MVFAETLKSTRPAAIDALAARVARANKLAKTCDNALSRRLAYRAKADALAALLRLGADAAQVVEVSLTTGLVTVWVRNRGGRCFHCPIDAFDLETRKSMPSVIANVLVAA